MLQNELSFQSPEMATIRCSNGHILLVNLTQPESVHREHFQDILNGAERLPISMFQMAMCLENKGYVECEWGSHRAYTEGSPVVPDVPANLETTGGIPVDGEETGEERVKVGNLNPDGAVHEASLEGVKPERAWETLSDDELHAAAIASGIDLDDKTRDDIILALMVNDDKDSEENNKSE